MEGGGTREVSWYTERKTNEGVNAEKARRNERGMKEKKRRNETRTLRSARE
jgi:hypothetical protein